MDGYLFDTCAISALLDPQHPSHANVKRADDAIETGTPKFVSRITIAELRFGLLLDEAATGRQHPRAIAVLTGAERYPLREITKHTAADYAELRKKLAVTHLSALVRSQRPRWISQWKDRVTGERLQIDENDLWICAQAREHNLTVLTTDEKMVIRMRQADPDLKFWLVASGR